MKIKKFKRKKVFILLLLVLIFIVWPYTEVEILTLLYGEQFKLLYDASGWIENPKYFKVMEYSDDYADVLYAAMPIYNEDSPRYSKHSKRVEAIFLYHFKKESGVWVLDDWEILWARLGTADKFYWPMYPHI